MQLRCRLTKGTKAGAKTHCFGPRGTQLSSRCLGSHVQVAAQRESGFFLHWGKTTLRPSWLVNWMVSMRKRSFPLPMAKPVLMQTRVVLPVQGSRPRESPRHLQHGNLKAAGPAAHPSSRELSSVVGEWDRESAPGSLTGEVGALTGKSSGQLWLCFPKDVKECSNPPVPRPQAGLFAAAVFPSDGPSLC